jgi:hypothetical protein
MAPIFDRAVDSLSAALHPDTTRHYRGTARNFLTYLGANHPDVHSLEQLRREPHILGWISRLHSQVPPRSTIRRTHPSNSAICLRCERSKLSTRATQRKRWK